MKINRKKIYNFIEKVTPPVMLPLLKNSKLLNSTKRYINRHAAKIEDLIVWNDVKEGPLKGKKILISQEGEWQKEMIDGTYDKFFFDYIDKIDLRGKTILEIGAHIGYHTLGFAQIVGEKGMVYAFEPNIFNIERLILNVKKNEELSKNITICEYAISDKDGEEEFVFSQKIEKGSSSGSFLDRSHTTWEKDVYENEVGFKRTKVKTFSLDSLYEKSMISSLPDMMKIDVEGAEYLVIDGAKNILKKFKPLLLIEIHSIFNMLKVGEALKELNYKVELLKEEKDGRCFIAAK